MYNDHISDSLYSIYKAFLVCAIFDIPYEALLGLSIFHVLYSMHSIFHIHIRYPYSISILGSLGALHRLQLCNQPVHISPLQLKLTKSTDHHQVFQISLSKTCILSEQNHKHKSTHQQIENILRNCCPMAICKTGNTISR